MHITTYTCSASQPLKLNQTLIIFSVTLTWTCNGCILPPHLFPLLKAWLLPSPHQSGAAVQQAVQPALVEWAASGQLHQQWSHLVGMAAGCQLGPVLVSPLLLAAVPGPEISTVRRITLQALNSSRWIMSHYGALGHFPEVVVVLFFFFFFADRNSENLKSSKEGNSKVADPRRIPTPNIADLIRIPMPGFKVKERLHGLNIRPCVFMIMHSYLCLKAPCILDSSRKMEN